MAGTISTLGIGSGLELQSILDQLKAGEQIPITRKKAEKLAIEDRVATFDTLQTNLLAMKDKALSLSLSSTYIKRKVSLSDNRPASVTVQDGIDTGSYNLEVTSLAKKSSWKTSAGVAAADSYVNSTGKDMQFSYQLGDETRTLTVKSGTTISQLAAAINDDTGNLGITASVSKDGSGTNPYRLLLQSDTTGEAGRISNVSMRGFDQWSTNSSFALQKTSIKSGAGDSDWSASLPSVSGAWTGQPATASGTWNYTFTTANDGTIGTDAITLNYTSDLGTNGSIVIPADYTAGTKIAGPDGMELTFTPGEALNTGNFFKTQAETDEVPAGDFTYTYNGTPRSLAIGAGTTLQELADQINNDPANVAGSKVTASLVGTGSGEYRLKLASDAAGADVNITGTVAGLEMTEISSSLSFSEEAGAGGESLDAVVKLGGVSYSRSTNTITDIVDGMTIKLQATGETSVDVAEDSGDVGTQIKSFVENLVKFLNEVDENDDYNRDTKTGGSLFGVSSVSTFRRQLVNEVLTSVDIEGSSIKSLVDLGLEVARDGSITIDEDTLNSAISSNFEDVKKLMLGDSGNGIKGWADTVNETLRYATRSTTGLIATEKTSAETRIASLETQIERAEALLDKRYEILTRQFQQLDSFSSTMNSMSSYLASQFDAMSNAQSSDK